MSLEETTFPQTSAAEGKVYRTIRDWVSILRLVREAGPVLVMSRTESAILGRHMNYPRLAADREEVALSCLESDSTGMLQHDFRHWAEGWVWTEVVNGTRIEALEFADELGRGVHKICATEFTDLRAWDGVLRRVRAQATDADELLHLQKTNHLEADERVDETADGLSVTHSWQRLFHAATFHHAVIGVVIPNMASTIGGCFIPGHCYTHGPWVKMETVTGELFFFKPGRIASITPVGVAEAVPGVPTLQLECRDGEDRIMMQVFLCRHTFANQIEELLELRLG